MLVASPGFSSPPTLTLHPAEVKGMFWSRNDKKPNRWGRGLYKERLGVIEVEREAITEAKAKRVIELNMTILFCTGASLQ